MIEQNATPARFDSQSAFAEAVNQVIEGIRRHQIHYKEIRIVLAITEFSLCKGRPDAVFPDQGDLAKAAKLTKQQVSRGLPWVELKGIVQRRAPFYGIILPASEWRVPLRVKEGQQLELAALEAWLANPSCYQPDLIPIEPRLALQRRVPPGGTGRADWERVAESATGVVKSATADGKPVAESATGVIKSATADGKPVAESATGVIKPATQNPSRGQGQPRDSVGSIGLDVHRILSRLAPAESSPQQLASATTVPSTRSSKLAEPAQAFVDAVRRQWPETPDGAIEFLEVLNTQQGDNALRKPQWAHKWTKLAADEPGYIVGYLRRKLLKQMSRDAVVAKPLGLIASIAACERRL